MRFEETVCFGQILVRLTCARIRAIHPLDDDAQCHSQRGEEHHHGRVAEGIPEEEGVTGHNKQVIADGKANDRCRDTGSEAAVQSGNYHCKCEKQKRSFVVCNRVHGKSRKRRPHDRQKSDTVRT